MHRIIFDLLMGSCKVEGYRGICHQSICNTFLFMIICTYLKLLTSCMCRHWSGSRGLQLLPSLCWPGPGDWRWSLGSGLAASLAWGALSPLYGYNTQLYSNLSQVQTKRKNHWIKLVLRILHNCCFQAQEQPGGVVGVAVMLQMRGETPDPGATPSSLHRLVSKLTQVHDDHWRLWCVTQYIVFRWSTEGTLPVCTSSLWPASCPTLGTMSHTRFTSLNLVYYCQQHKSHGPPCHPKSKE